MEIKFKIKIQLVLIVNFLIHSSFILVKIGLALFLIWYFHVFYVKMVEKHWSWTKVGVC